MGLATLRTIIVIDPAATLNPTSARSRDVTERGRERRAQEP